MENEIIELIGVEHLKTVLSSLSSEDIVKPAYENWYACQRTGHTILNLEDGEVSGLSVELNQLPLSDMIYIELYTIKSGEDPIEPKELFSDREYEEFLKFIEEKNS